MSQTQAHDGPHDPLAGSPFAGRPGAALRSRVATFIAQEIKPFMPQWYRENEIPRELYVKAGRADLFGFEKSDGGWKETEAWNPVIVMTALAEVSPGIAVSLLAHGCLGLYAVHRFGNEAQKAQFFDPGVTGEKIAAFANTEPGAGSDASSIALSASAVEGGYVLNGTKMFITNGSAADFLVVSAVTDPHAKRKHDGITMFLVEAEGIRRQKIRKRVWVPSDLSTLHFKDHFVPARAVLGEINQGFRQVMLTFNSSRITIAALTYGTSLGAYKLAFKRANTREVFGRKVFEHEGKSMEFADFFTRLEASRLLILQAAWRKEQGLDYTMAASMAKLFACRESFEICRFAADIYGASGVIEENPINKFPLDAWAASLGEGTNDVQKRVIAKALKRTFEV